MTTAATSKLEAALAIWRRTGTTDDAVAVYQRGQEALAGWTPPGADSERAFHRAWLRAVDDPVGRGWALVTLLEQIPGSDPIQRASAIAKRLDALVRHGPDPRFGAAARAVRQWDAALSVQRLRAALARLEAAADAHGVDVEPRRWPTASPPQLDTSRGPRAVPVVSEFPPATPRVRALWQAVHAQPDDDGALAVLADALQGIDDPRGELIALQLATGDGGDDVARIERRRVLIASCGAAWLGRLAQITAAASFERGVLRRWQPVFELPPTDRRWEALCTDPRLATVTDLVSPVVAGDGYNVVHGALIASPAMRSLARIDLYEPSPLYALARGSPSLRHVAFSFPPEVCAAFFGRLSAALQHRPSITSIAIHESLFDRFAAAPWFRRLTAVTLGVGSQMRRGLARWSALPPGMRLTLVPDARVAPCSTSYPWDFGVALSRDGDAVVARLSGEWLLLPLDVLTALPGDVARIEVDHASAGMVERVRSALGRPAVDIVHRPEPLRAAVFVPTARDVRRARALADTMGE
jgi:uncharacterized protein (TIGR02996 family)